MHVSRTLARDARGIDRGIALALFTHNAALHFPSAQWDCVVLHLDGEDLGLYECRVQYNQTTGTRLDGYRIGVMGSLDFISEDGALIRVSRGIGSKHRARRGIFPNAHFCRPRKIGDWLVARPDRQL